MKRYTIAEQIAQVRHQLAYQQWHDDDLQEQVDTLARRSEESIEGRYLPTADDLRSLHGSNSREARLGGMGDRATYVCSGAVPREQWIAPMVSIESDMRQKLKNLSAQWRKQQ